MSFYDTKDSKSMKPGKKQAGAVSVGGKMNHQQEIEWPLEESGQLSWVLPISVGESAT